MTDKIKNIKKLLLADWDLLTEAKNIFLHSSADCSTIEDVEELQLHELDKMEAYTARFARLLDFYLQKILKGIDKMEANSPGTLKDILNRAVQVGLIQNAEELLELKIYRNEIVHDYIQYSQRKIFFEIRTKEPFLLDCISMTGIYIIKLNG